jgi:hypothetical protein
VNEKIRNKSESKFFDLFQLPEVESDHLYWNELPFEDFVRCNSFLQFLISQQIHSLETSMTLERLTKGEVIANEGDAIPFGIIKSGKVEVSQLSETSSKEEGRLILRSGDVFGYEYMDFNDGADSEASSQNTYRVSEAAEIYFCSMESLNKILFAEQDDVSHWISRALDLWCRSFCRVSVDHMHRSFLTEFLLMWHSRIPIIENFGELLDRMEMLYSSISPDLDFKDNLEDLILKLRPLFVCDRCSFYTLDVPNNLMYLFTVDVAKTVDRLQSDVYDNSNHLYGLRMPMKGIAAQVAKTGRPMNLIDCYMSEYFDSTMDIRTGYLSKQMLCVPVVNRSGDTIGVIQFINSVNDQAFSLHDEMLASFAATLLSPVLDQLLFRDSSLSRVKPSSSLFASVAASAASSSSSVVNVSQLLGNKTVTVNFQRLLTISEHRHIKFTCRCVEFGNDITSMRTSIMFTAQPHSEDIKLVELNTVMQFSKLEYGRLSPSTFLLVEFFSKNNHPSGWTLFPFFNSERYLQQGVLDVPVFYSNCPPDWLIVGNIYSTAQCMDLYDRDEYDRSIFLNGMCSGSLLVEIHPDQSTPSTTSSVAAGPLADNTSPMFYHEYAFAMPPCNFSSYMLHRQMVSSVNGEQSTWTIPEWLMTLQLPEARRRKFATTLCAHFMILNPETLALTASTSAAAVRGGTASPNNPHLSTVLDAETQQFLWEHRDSIQLRVPQLFSFFVFTMDWSPVEKQQWLLSTIHKWNRLSIAHLLPLLDVRFGRSPLHAFATSGLWPLSSSALLMLRFFLVTLTQAQFVSDHSLHRFLLYRVFGDAYPPAVSPPVAPISLPFIWQMIAIDHFHAYVGIKDQLLLQPFLKLLSRNNRAYIANGLSFFQVVHKTYSEFEAQGRLNLPAAPPGVDPNFAQETLSVILQEFKQRLSSNWPSDKPFVVPVGNLLTNTAHSTNIHILPAAPVLSHVQEVRLGSYYGKDSMIFTLNSASSLVADSATASPPVGLIYLPHVNYRQENIFNQTIQIMNFIFMDKNVPLSLFQSEIFPLTYDRVGNMCKVAVASYLPGAVSLNFLIVDAIKAFQKANKTQNMFQLRKTAEPALTKIPGDLLLSFFAASIGQQHQTSQPKQIAEFMEQIVRSFMPNLAGFLLVSHVLSLQGVNTNTTFVDRFGMLFVKNVTSLLGLDVNVFMGTNTTSGSNTPAGLKSKTLKRQPIFYLPCFVDTIGGSTSPLYRDFQQLLLTAFCALRDHAALLLWSVRCIFIAHEMPLEDMQAAVISLRESLMLDVTDEIACQQLQELLQRGLKADYQLKVK